MIIFESVVLDPIGNYINENKYWPPISNHVSMDQVPKYTR